MRNKLLYVHRKGPLRKWIDAAESKFRALLRKLAAEEGVELMIFESRSGPWPTFRQQIGYFADASVIVGFHGAGLALTAFAPKGAALVEIEPEDHRLGLFGNLQSSGIKYERYCLSKGTSKGLRVGSDLSDHDNDGLRDLLRERIREGKQLVLIHNQ